MATAPMLIGKLVQMTTSAKEPAVCKPASREEVIKACALHTGYPKDRAEKICRKRLEMLERTHRVSSYQICRGSPEVGFEQCGSDIRKLRVVGMDLYGEPCYSKPNVMMHTHPSRNVGLSPADIAFALRRPQSAVCVTVEDDRFGRKVECVVNPRRTLTNDEIAEWTERFQDCIDKAYASGSVTIDYYVDQDAFTIRPSRKVISKLNHCSAKYVDGMAEKLGIAHIIF